MFSRRTSNHQSPLPLSVALPSRAAAFTVSRPSVLTRGSVCSNRLGEPRWRAASRPRGTRSGPQPVCSRLCAVTAPPGLGETPCLSRGRRARGGADPRRAMRGSRWRGEALSGGRMPLQGPRPTCEHHGNPEAAASEGRTAARPHRDGDGDGVRLHCPQHEGCSHHPAPARGSGVGFSAQPTPWPRQLPHGLPG